MSVIAGIDAHPLAGLEPALAHSTRGSTVLPAADRSTGDPTHSGDPSDRGPDTLVQLSPHAPAADADATQTAQDQRSGRGQIDHGATTDSPPTANQDQADAPEEEVSDADLADPGATAANGQPLTKEEQEEVEKLKERDSEVRRHEQAHKAAAGPHARGGPTYDYETGPDGKRYAVGGSVQIDTSEVPGDPQATIQKMQVIQRAAQAPAEPSAQDRRVAAQAARTAQKARQELAQQQSEQPDATGQADANPAGDGPAASTPNGSSAGDLGQAGSFQVQPDVGPFQSIQTSAVPVGSLIDAVV